MLDLYVRSCSTSTDCGDSRASFRLRIYGRSYGALLNQRLKLKRFGQKADGLPWESTDLIRFRVRVASDVPDKARQGLNKVMVDYPMLFTEVRFDNVAETVQTQQLAAMKRPASKDPSPTIRKRPARGA